MIIDDKKLSILAVAVFGSFTAASATAYARQLCSYTICSQELGKENQCETFTKELEPSEQAILFFDPDRPVTGYDCKPIVNGKARTARKK